MIEKKRVTLFEVLVYVAYGYFILIGLAWLVVSYLWGSFFNFWALGTVALFGTQAWFRHRLTNLILGILILPVCIYGTLEFLWVGQKTGFNFFVDVMMWLSALGIVMACILLFGYMKLSFKDH